MSNFNVARNTVAARLTAAGRSAIATVGVAGADAARQVATCFHAANGRPLDAAPSGRAVFGRWTGGPINAPTDSAQEMTAEEVVVHCWSDARVDIHCHGGNSAVTRILQDLARGGVATVEWLAWLAATEPDLLRAEARLALTAARTQRAATLLLHQYGGALPAAQLAIIEAITHERTESAVEQLDRLLARASCGLHLTTPWQVVLTGRPNAGKSSLINALVGYQRAIVHELPGTTRDVVTATTAFDGWPVELSDTAGLRDSADPIETAGVARARDKLQSADLVVLVCDASLDWTDADRQLRQATPDALVVHNKCDRRRPPRDDRPAGLEVSALTGAGVDSLAAAIVARLVPDPPRPGDAVPFTKRQTKCLTQARSYLAEGRLDDALQAVRSLASDAYYSSELGCRDV